MPRPSELRFKHIVDELKEEYERLGELRYSNVRIWPPGGRGGKKRRPIVPINPAIVDLRREIEDMAKYYIIKAKYYTEGKNG